MITKARLLERARVQGLLPTTVEKDYVLGWMLAAISQHARLSTWVFKGGTCLKKCYFETYRFSEDLDFTIPAAVILSPEAIAADLAEAGAWVEERSGITFPAEKIKVEQYTNLRGKESYQARVVYACRLNLSRHSLQRIKFDITQDEVLADAPDQRDVSHPYEDAQDPAPRVRCYSIDEILAEKTRALYEREGLARDVYDIVHLSRDFRDSINPVKASALLRAKFAFKGLPEPSVALIVGRVKAETLRANGMHQLQHQLPQLPPVDSFLSDLTDAIAWWFDPDPALQPLHKFPAKDGERSVARQHLPAYQQSGWGGAASPAAPIGGMGPFDRIRYAARNRLCAEIRYDGVYRIVEPYAVRLAGTGNTLLHVHELLKDGRQIDDHRSYDVTKIEAVLVTDRPFTARYQVEL